MARVDSRLDTILLAIVARLISQVSGANEASCFLTIEAGDELSGAPGDFLWLVSPMSGSFDDTALDGGGQNVATDYFDFSVTTFSTVMLDMSGQDTKAMADATLGLITKHRAVLKALTVHDLIAVGGADNILRDPILPRDYQFGRNGRGLAFVRQVFRLSYDWDLPV
jgi:hypothetical protein